MNTIGPARGQTEQLEPLASGCRPRGKICVDAHGTGQPCLLCSAAAQDRLDGLEHDQQVQPHGLRITCFLRTSSRIKKEAMARPGRRVPGLATSALTKACLNG